MNILLCNSINLHFSNLFFYNNWVFTRGGLTLNQIKHSWFECQTYNKKVVQYCTKIEIVHKVAYVKMLQNVALCFCWAMFHFWTLLNHIALWCTKFHIKILMIIYTMEAFYSHWNSLQQTDRHTLPRIELLSHLKIRDNFLAATNDQELLRKPQTLLKMTMINVYI